LADGIFIS